MKSMELQNYIKHGMANVIDWLTANKLLTKQF